MPPLTIAWPDGRQATISHYQWTSAHPLIAAALNAGLNADGPSGADPDPDYTVAQEAIRHYGGTIVSGLPRPVRAPGLIY